MSTIILPDIALYGRMGSGKSTIADMLVKHYDYERVSFAQPLKEMATKLWGDAALHNRAYLQKLGVAVRDIEKDTWVNLLHARVALARNNAALNGYRQPRFVVDDMRFPNEFDRLWELGFVMVRVDANRNIRLARLQANGKLQDEDEMEHASETALDNAPWQAAIVNDGDQVTLADRVIGVLDGLRR